MGWAKGRIIADDVWEAIKPFIPDEDVQEAAEALVEVFTDHGCTKIADTNLGEDAGLREIEEEDPDRDEDEDEEKEEEFEEDDDFDNFDR
jgi:hypothetical protein